MSQESPGSAVEPDLPRTREVDTGRFGSDKRWQTFIEDRRWVRMSLVCLSAVVAGLILAPRLGSRTYPTDPNLVGTPAVENIKAPHDVEAIDGEMSQRLHEEAVSQVLRVYDFDAQMGAVRSSAALQAFASMRERLRSVTEEHPEYVELEGMSEQRRTQVEAELAKQLRTADFERILGSALKPGEAALLAAARYAEALGQGLARLLEDALRHPVVAGPAALDPDRGKGINVQQVPDDGAPQTTIADVDSIRVLEPFRKELPILAERLLPDLEPPQRELVAGLAVRLLQPNLTLNRAATELAREVARLSVKPAIIAVKKGEMVIRDGDRLTRRHLLIFEALSTSSRSTSIWLVAVGAMALVLILTVTGLSLGRRQGRRWRLTGRDMLFLTALFISSLAAARLWLEVTVVLHERFTGVPRDVFLFIMPLAAVTIVARLVLRVELAVLFGLVWGLLVGLLVEGEGLFTIYAVVGTFLGGTAISSISARSDLLRAAVWVGLGQGAVAVGLALFQGETDGFVYLVSVLGALSGGIIAGFVALGLTPVIEAAFGYTTDLKLLELANLNHPGLKELIVQAPGSYHHSIIVGSLVEAAAEAIGANPLLARVMAYYHDLGKGCNPTYFIENQRAGGNPHDKLKPSMSAMVIRRHVTDGLEIAKNYGLGEQILAGVAEHHGTTLIQYFFHKAKEQEDESNPVSENDYRYPGRKPQTRESALVMLGDSVEAASRSLADATPARLKGLVNRIINMKFTDGQLEECDLTLRDLHVIAKSFSRILMSIYHQRPEYPGVLKDITGSRKQHNGNGETNQNKKPKAQEPEKEEDKPGDIRRLGL